MDRCTCCLKPLSLRLFGQQDNCLINGMCNDCIVNVYHTEDEADNKMLKTADIDKYLNFKGDDEGNKEK